IPNYLACRRHLPHDVGPAGHLHHRRHAHWFVGRFHHAVRIVGGFHPPGHRTADHLHVLLVVQTCPCACTQSPAPSTQGSSIGCFRLVRYGVISGGCEYFTATGRRPDAGRPCSRRLDSRRLHGHFFNSCQGGGPPA